MDMHQKITSEANAWQATYLTIQMNLKDKHLQAAGNTSALNLQPIPRKLTTEACFMLCSILILVILTAIGSSITVYENCKKLIQECYSTATKSKMKSTGIFAEEEKKLNETSSITGLKNAFKFFCIITNSRRTFNFSPKDEQLIFLHGIRAISMMWAAFLHTSLLCACIFKTSDEYQHLVKSRMTMFIYNGNFAVDTFFILGGFLNAYLFYQRYDKRKGNISWISFYVRRFLRISPLYFFVIGIYSTLFSYLGSGVLWPAYDTNPVCKENWMWHALYFNNFQSVLKQCLCPTWYLACEMQLYIISPIFLLLLMRKPKTAYTLIVLGICGSSINSFIYTKQYKLLDGSRMFSEYYPNKMGEYYRRYLEYFDVIYMKPFPRLGSYLIGLTLGHYLYQRKFNPIKRLSPITLSLGWMTTAVFMWISIFGLYGRKESTVEFAVYNAFNHLLFSCGVAWVIFVCATGHGGFVNRFLSSKVFIVISSISYAIYLTHFAILERYYLKFEELLDFSWMISMQHLALQALQIFIAAAVVTTIFETPMSRITELFFQESKQETKSVKEI